MSKLCLKCGKLLNSQAVECYGCKTDDIEEIITKLPPNEFYNIRVVVSSDPNAFKEMLAIYDESPTEYMIKYNQLKQEKDQQKNIPKCPTCSSTNLSKIPTTSKAVSVGLFGLFSQKIKKTWHCNNCKYEW